MDLVKEETKRLLHHFVFKKEMMQYRAKMVRFRTNVIRNKKTFTSFCIQKRNDAI